MKKDSVLKCILFLSLVLTGCSKIKLAYEFAPGIIVGRMDDYFDLESKQKTALKATIKSEIDRIVIDQLPRYIELDKEWASLIQKKDLKKPELKAHMLATRNWMLGVFASMEPALTPHAMTLTPKQFEYFQKEVSKELEKLEEKVAKPEGQKKELRRRFTFALDWNFKSLNSDEEKLFEEFLDHHIYPFQLETINRRSSTNSFIDASKSPETFKTHLAKIFRAPMSMRGKEYA